MPLRLTAAVAVTAAALSLAACTTTVEGTATATKPTLVTPQQLADRIPEATYWGDGAKADSSFDDDLDFFCSKADFADPAEAGAQDPVTFTIQQNDNSGSPKVGSESQQIAAFIGAFDSIGAAKKFQDTVSASLDSCPPEEQLEFDKNVQTLTFVPQPLDHEGWRGTYLLSKISIKSKSTGNVTEGIQLAVVAWWRNVQVQMTIYGFGGFPSGTTDDALTKGKELFAGYLDQLSAKG